MPSTVSTTQITPWPNWASRRYNGSRGLKMTEIDKTVIPTKLLWVDLEMTGLDPQQHVIIEVAAEVTDFNMVTLASYESLVSQPDDKLDNMNEWAQRQHDTSGLTERVRREGKPQAQVTAELSAL